MTGHPIVEQLQVRLFREPRYIDPFFCRKAGQIIRENRIEILHLHRSKDLASFALYNKIPKILTLQIESRLKKKDIFHRFVYSRVDRVITITERMRGFAQEALPLDPAKIFTLHYGIDVENFRSSAEDRWRMRNKWNFPDNAFVVGLVGRLEESKGQQILLEAFAELYREFPEMYLVLVGESPPGNDEYDRILLKIANELGIYDRVNFTGFQTELASVYSALDICVLASREETFGLVLLEAMSAGVPIIATNAGGVPEIITNLHNGILIPPEDPHALAEAIQKLKADDELRADFRRNGLQVIKDKFSNESHMRSLENHFSEVLANTRR